LYLGEKKEMGILAERKSAMWVFSQIRNENRDPAILYYLTGNKVALRIFPFTKNQTRKTGFELLHKEPVKLEIDGNIVELGNAKEVINTKIETDNIIYVSSKQKRSLKKIKRKPYFYFLIDISKNKKKNLSDFINRIQLLIKNNKSLLKNAKISFVNTYVKTIKFNDNWKQNLQDQNFEGGFFLERAIKKALFSAYIENSDNYPVIVVVTDSIQNAILDKDFSDFKITFPESDLFFYLTENGKLEAHSLTLNPIQSLPDSISYSFEHSVLEYKHKDNTVSYLRNNNEPSIILKNDIVKVLDNEIKEKDWQTALRMQGMWISQVLHPEIAKREWLELVKFSFISKVMTHLTSYLVVENEAQKDILKKKQKQVLSGNKSLDLGEETQRMSEPNMVIVFVLFCLILFFVERRKKKFSHRK
jgi:hypothetical protein